MICRIHQGLGTRSSSTSDAHDALTPSPPAAAAGLKQMRATRAIEEARIAGLHADRGILALE
jgi:hypothetical protein